MAKKNYEKMSEEILRLVGGKENISGARHCVTRLRLNLKDRGLVQMGELKKADGVLGVQEVSGELQIIIGADVSKIYPVFVNLAGIKSSEMIQENKDEKQEKLWKKIGNGFISYLSKTVTAFIPLLIGAALCRTIAMIFGPDMLGLISGDSDIYTLLNTILYNAVFYFMPVYLGYSAAKTLHYNPMYGMFIAAMIIVPDFVAMVGVRETFSVFGIPAPVAGYGQSFLPIILGAWICKYVLILIKKISPDSMLSILEPLLLMLIMPVIMFAVCAPLGSYLGSALGSFFELLSNSNVVVRAIGCMLLGATIPYMTAGGMHAVVYQFAFVTFFENGYETFVFPAGYSFSFAICGLALGAFLKLKKGKQKSAALSHFTTAALAGISEPALFGIVFKYKRAIAVLSIVSGIGGLYCGIFQPAVYGAGTMPTIFTLVGMWGGSTANVINGLIMSGIVFVAGAVGSYFFIDYNTEL